MMAEVLVEKKAQLSFGEKLKIMETLIAREAKIWTRFRISFFMDIAAMIAQASIFLFIGMTFIKDSPEMLKYGGDYVTYLILGLIFLRFMDSSLTSPYQALSDSYWWCRLETILLSPCSINLMITSGTIWGYIKTLLDMIIYLLLGLLFGMHLGMPTSLYLVLFVFILGVVSVLGFGLISASMFMLINAKGWNDPVKWIVSTLQGLVCGIYYPITILPNWLQKIGLCLPQTYAIDAVRRLFLRISPSTITLSPQEWFSFTTPLGADILILCLFLLFLLPLGFFSFKLGLRKAKSDGCLSRWT